MLTTLSRLKERLAIPATDTISDALLTQAIASVSAALESVCGRGLMRVADHVQRFPAYELFVSLDLYPVEGGITKFQLQRFEGAGGTVDITPTYLFSPERVVVSFDVPVGSPGQIGILTYSGGYVDAGSTAGTGQFALPADLEGAACEQVAFWFANRERVGQKMWYPQTGNEGGTLWQPAMPPEVTEVLKSYRRIVI
jgi:hypothetical protein